MKRDLSPFLVHLISHIAALCGFVVGQCRQSSELLFFTNAVSHDNAVHDLLLLAHTNSVVLWLKWYNAWRRPRRPAAPADVIVTQQWLRLSPLTRLFPAAFLSRATPGRRIENEKLADVLQGSQEQKGNGVLV